MTKALELTFVVALAAGVPPLTFAQELKNPALECYASMPARPPLALLADKIMLSGEPKATLEMQALKSRPDADEKVALSRWTVMRDTCFELGTGWMDAIQAPRWFRSITMQTKDSSDALAAALYRGELTYGEFNVKNMALSAEMRKRLDDAVEVARREHGGPSPSAPVQPPTARANNLQQDQYQCDQDAARSYPQVLVQTMTSPGFQAAPRPAQTNCTQFGNQINCRSGPTGLDSSIYNRPPTYVTEDSNLSNRRASVRACMLAKGYAAR